MIVSTVPAVVQFAVLESPAALQLPAQLWWIAVVLATVCTVLPVFLVAEALKRIGANHFALIGALGPVTTVLADFALLGRRAQRRAGCSAARWSFRACCWSPVKRS